MKQYTALGKSVNKFEQLDRIETACQFIEYHSDQLISAGPVTGYPDFYEVRIQIEADGAAIETKTLKLYLETYKDKETFCEDLAVKICSDVFQACDPFKCTVTLVQRRRGGIQITARHELIKKPSQEP